MKEGWEYKKLGDITTTINGLWTGKKPPFKTVAVVRNTNFTKDCNLDMSNIAFIDVEERQYATRKLVYGDIIIEKSGGSDKQPVGRPVLFEISDGDYSFSNFTSTLRIKNTKEIIPRFLHKALYEAYLRGETFKMQSKTTGIHNLDFKAYNKLLIPTPPISEQQRIVEELDLLSSIIEKKKAQLKELDDLAQSLFYEMFGDPITNEKGWKIGKISNFINVKGGFAFKSQRYTTKGIRLVQIANVWKDSLSWDDITYISEEDAKTNSSFLLKQGDIVMAMTRPIIQSLEAVKVAIVNEHDIPCILNQRVCKFEIRDSIDNIWLYQFLRLPYFKYKIKEFSSKGMQPNVSSREIESIQIFVPPFSLQQQFASKIEAIEHQKELIKQSIKEVETLFNSRMDYYFN